MIFVINTIVLTLYIILHYLHSVFVLYRNALEEFVQINYPNTQMAVDGQRNMYTTKELKGVCYTMNITNLQNVDENKENILFVKCELGFSMFNSSYFYLFGKTFIETFSFIIIGRVFKSY